MWEGAGWVFPGKWQEAVEAMEDSSNINNRMMAFFAEAFARPSMIGIENNIDKFFLYQVFLSWKLM